jgi:hypothetical protein
MTFDDYWGNKNERWNGVLDIKNFAREVWEAARLELESKPTDDIPIGAPCYAWDDGEESSPFILFYSPDVRKKYDNVRPITIWDIDEKYGGAPSWAIARAYTVSMRHWLLTEEEVKEYINNICTIERRPKKEA